MHVDSSGLTAASDIYLSLKMKIYNEKFRIESLRGKLTSSCFPVLKTAIKLFDSGFGQLNGE